MKQKKINLVLMMLGLLASGPLQADMIDSLDEVDKKAPDKKQRQENESETSDQSNLGSDNAGTPTKQPTKPAIDSSTEKPSPPKKSVSSPPSSEEGKATTGPNDSLRRRLPIKLKSDGEAIYSKNGGIVHLVKNVRISQGNLFFRADEAKAYFISLGGEEVVDKVEIEGNVRLTKHSIDPSENVKATGDKAYFYNSKNLITLVGNARLLQGGHLIKGKKITYDLNTSIVKVDRAEGVVQPGEAGSKNE